MTHDTSAILSCSDLHREYLMGDSTVRALSGVDLDVTEGEVLVVLGPSGAGKSTLLHMLGGIDKPTRGSVRLRGLEITNLPDRRLARLRSLSFGFVFQFHYLIPELSVMENVMAAGRIAGGKPRDLRVRAAELLEELDMSGRAKHMPSQISGGERQRTAVARALFNQPEVILCDEPTGNLDSATGKLIRDLIVRLNRDRGMTFIIVTHDETFGEIAARTARLVDGRITVNS